MSKIPRFPRQGGYHKLWWIGWRLGTCWCWVFRDVIILVQLIDASVWYYWIYRVGIQFQYTVSHQLKLRMNIMLTISYTMRIYTQPPWIHVHLDHHHNSMKITHCTGTKDITWYLHILWRPHELLTLVFLFYDNVIIRQNSKYQYSKSKNSRKVTNLGVSTTTIFFLPPLPNTTCTMVSTVTIRSSLYYYDEFYCRTFVCNKPKQRHLKLTPIVLDVSGL